MSDTTVIDECVMKMKGATFSLKFVSVDPHPGTCMIDTIAEIRTDTNYGDFKFNSAIDSDQFITFPLLADYLESHILRVRTYGGDEHRLELVVAAMTPRYDFVPLSTNFQIGAQAGGIWEENGEAYGDFGIKVLVNLRKPGESGLESVFVGVESRIELQACENFVAQLRATVKHLDALCKNES